MTIQFQKYAPQPGGTPGVNYLFDSGDPMTQQTITEIEAKQVITECRQTFGPEDTEDPPRWMYLMQGYRINGMEFKQKIFMNNGVNQVHYRLVVIFKDDADATQFELRWR